MLVKKHSPRHIKEPIFERYLEQIIKDEGEWPSIIKLQDPETPGQYYAVVTVWGEMCNARGTVSILGATSSSAHFNHCPLVAGHHGPCWQASEELMEEIPGALAVLVSWKSGTPR